MSYHTDIWLDQSTPSWAVDYYSTYLPSDSPHRASNQEATEFATLHSLADPADQNDCDRLAARATKEWVEQHVELFDHFPRAEDIKAYRAAAYAGYRKRQDFALTRKVDGSKAIYERYQIAGQEVKETGGIRLRKAPKPAQIVAHQYDDLGEPLDHDWYEAEAKLARNTTRRHPRHTVTDPSQFLDDVASALTGLPAEPESQTELELKLAHEALVAEVEGQEDGSVYYSDPADARAAVEELAARVEELTPDLDLPEAGPVETHTGRVYRIAVDATHAQIEVENVTRTRSWLDLQRCVEWRQGFDTLPAARAEAARLASALKARGHAVTSYEHAPEQRKLIVFNAARNTVTVKPDHKGRRGKFTPYPTAEAAAAALAEAEATLTAAGRRYRVWRVRERVAA